MLYRLAVSFKILHSLRINMITNNRLFMDMSLFGPKGPTYTFELGGLTCSKCVATVKRTVKALDGVKKAKVSFDMKKLTVMASCEMDTDVIMTAIVEEGFEAEESD